MGFESSINEQREGQRSVVQRRTVTRLSRGKRHAAQDLVLQGVAPLVCSAGGHTETAAATADGELATTAAHVLFTHAARWAAEPSAGGAGNSASVLKPPR
ncbi:MAG: hypothetical protein D6760_10900 [Deltaproteobacteria bacterium]|nr:MAG: hypothetical protein D6760_10900 [Deltaproteobacteria bacterium]